MFRRIRRKLFRSVVVSGLGAAAAYFLDPDRGRARRAQTADQARSFLRRRQAGADRQARYAAGVAQGEAVEARGGGVPHPADDVEVARLVKQALHRVGFPTSDVTVEAVEGIVTLRGQVASGDQMEKVTQAVAEVAGVTEVHSFLHLPGTPAPNKASALRAS